MKYFHNGRRLVEAVFHLHEESKIRSRESRRDLTLAAILVVALIDAVLLAVLRIQVIQSSGADLGFSRPAIMRGAPR